MESFKKIVTSAVESVATAITRDCYIDYTQTQNISTTAEKKFLFNLNVQGKSGGRYEEAYFDAIDQAKEYLRSGMPELLEDYPEVATHSSTVKASEIYFELTDEVKRQFEEIVSQITETIKKQSVGEETYTKVVDEAKTLCASVLSWEDILKKAVYMISHNRFDAEWYDLTTDFIGYVNSQTKENILLCTSVSSVINVVSVSFVKLYKEIYEKLYLKDITSVNDPRLSQTLKNDIAGMYEKVRVPDRIYSAKIREAAPSVVDVRHSDRKSIKQYRFNTNFQVAEFKWSAEKAAEAKAKFLRTQFKDSALLNACEIYDKRPRTVLKNCFKKGIGVDVDLVYQLLAPYKFKAKKLVPIAVTQDVHPDDADFIIENLLDKKIETKKYSLTLKIVLYVIILIMINEVNDFIKFLPDNN